MIWTCLKHDNTDTVVVHEGRDCPYCACLTVIEDLENSCKYCEDLSALENQIYQLNIIIEKKQKQIDILELKLKGKIND